MLKLIVYKELKEITGSAKFAATFGICSILIILAFITGIQKYHNGVREYEASKAAQQSQFEASKSWKSVPRRNTYLPQEPLAALVMGISNDIGRTTNLYDTSFQVMRNSTYSQDTIFAVFRFLDLEFVFMIVLSLFAILFAFDAVNGEKERGTLRLSFANPIPRAVYILGKIIGTFLALAVPLLVPVLIGMLFLPLMGVHLSIGEWVRLSLFIICGLLYLGVFLSLSLFISSVTKRSSSSFLFMLVIWVFSVLIIPRASVLLAGNIYAVPSLSKIYYQRLQLEMNSARDVPEKVKEPVQKYIQEMSQKAEKDPDAMKKISAGISEIYNKAYGEIDKEVGNYVNRLFEERYNEQDKQEKLALGISRISPTAVFTLAATELCGTSIELRNNYREKAAAYSKIYEKFLEEKQNQDNAEGDNSQAVNTEEIPLFVYESHELPVIIQRALPDMGILALFNLIFFCGAFTAFLRYDLR